MAPRGPMRFAEACRWLTAELTRLPYIPKGPPPPAPPRARAPPPARGPRGRRLAAVRHTCVCARVPSLTHKKGSHLLTTTHLGAPSPTLGGTPPAGPTRQRGRAFALEWPPLFFSSRAVLPGRRACLRCAAPAPKTLSRRVIRHHRRRAPPRRAWPPPHRGRGTALRAGGRLLARM
ncbi:MAG: hypothetical protein J3K34DRAFT_414815 [Monoraphidium minutum]|nr:MAG: hypothetical protein J3K34DRAFT_414815 [Monoraphidium minutum]